jgi:hypothetical protein
VRAILSSVVVAWWALWSACVTACRCRCRCRTRTGALLLASSRTAALRFCCQDDGKHDHLSLPRYTIILARCPTSSHLISSHGPWIDRCSISIQRAPLTRAACLPMAPATKLIMSENTTAGPPAARPSPPRTTMPPSAVRLTRSRARQRVLPYVFIPTLRSAKR